MPIYEYHCQRCEQNFEVMQKFADEPLTTHEGCGGAVERLISSPALQFKGSGWYITDYARKNGSSGSGNSDSNGSSSSGESKAAPAKSETSSSKSDTTKK